MSPRNIKRDIEQRELRREHILEAALNTIARRGLDSASIKEIAKMAELSVGNIYHYFESKDIIFSELLQRGQHNYGAMVERFAQANLDPREKLYAICYSWIESKHNWAFTLMLHSIRMNDGVSNDLKVIATRRFTENLKPMANIMMQGQLQDVIKAGDPHQLAYYFVSLIQGLTLQLAPNYVVPVKIEISDIIKLFMSPVSDREAIHLFERFSSNGNMYKKMFDNL
ncbi:MAG: TetR/AcrR family transcriptional regulator [Candidatus Pristimantibacillus lignocellulolyticus]|uniref:TetR/AcrR family transcriptional regulator n=1 Tax=Candidatus Pristimantibacillus lignocellulolyticus TaxID=2994561 RepID=A0A9J6ZGQ8_9BACL|nr:MAG: TetR/AcrR family transcriptional regulator [Candidatus Pristimantibacillus lignocellulolyticus]